MQNLKIRPVLNIDKLKRKTNYCNSIHLLVFILFPPFLATCQYQITDTIAGLDNTYLYESNVALFNDIVACNSDILPGETNKNGTINVYKKIKKEWTIIQKIKLPEFIPDEGFGRAISINDKFLVVGAPYWDTIVGRNKLNDRGKVYIYSVVKNKYVLSQTFNGALGRYNEAFGSNVFIHDNEIFVTSPGATYADKSGKFRANAGSITVLKYDGSKYYFSQSLFSPNPTSAGRFGFGLQFCSENLIISEPRTFYSGCVHYYEKNDGNWVFVNSLKSGLEIVDAFGFSFSCNQNNLIIGAPSFTETNFHEGRVFLYKIIKGRSELKNTIHAPGLLELGNFGNKVAISGMDLLINTTPIKDTKSRPPLLFKFPIENIVNGGNKYDTILNPGDLIFPYYNEFGVTINNDIANKKVYVSEISGVNKNILHYQSKNILMEYRVHDNVVNSQGNYKVCADGASSLFGVIYTGDIQNVMLETISQNEQNNTQYGSFDYLGKTDDTLWYRYHHPLTFEQIDLHYSFVHLVFRQKITDRVVYSGILQIIRPPVLLIHGLWSEEKAFKKMADNLIFSKKYEPFQILSANYKNTHASFLNENRSIVRMNINKLKRQLNEKGTPFGKVDIIAHSMGGLLSRLYVQSVEYEQDVHKFIGLNVPHSGAGIANFVNNNPRIADVLDKLGLKTKLGALNDMAIGSKAINYILNGTLLNSEIVPSHSIATTFELPSSETKINSLNLTEFSIEHFLNRNLISAIHDGNQNDYAVSVPSQSGGLNFFHLSLIENQIHVGSMANDAIINRVIFLLGQPTKTNIFSSDGFKPIAVKYPDFPHKILHSSLRNKTSLPTFKKIKDTLSSDYRDSFYFEISFPEIYNSFSIFLQNPEGEIYFGKTNKSIDTMSWVNDNKTPGEYNIFGVGKDSIGNILFIDSIYSFNRELRNEISQIIVEDSINIQMNETRDLKILGKTIDGKLINLSHLKGLKFSFSNNLTNITNDVNLIGLKPGLDTMIVSFKEIMSSPMLINVLADPKNAFNINITKAAATCNQNNGSVIIRVSGDNAPFTVKWNDGRNVKYRDSLKPGYYEVMISDVLGNKQIEGIIIEEEVNNFFDQIWHTTDTLLSKNSFLSGYHSPASQYLWSTGDTTSSIKISTSGLYSLTISSPAGCTITDTINVITTTPSITIFNHPSFKILKQKDQSWIISPKNQGYTIESAILKDNKNQPVDTNKWQVRKDSKLIIVKNNGLPRIKYKLEVYLRRGGNTKTNRIRLNF